MVRQSLQVVLHVVSHNTNESVVMSQDCKAEKCSQSQQIVRGFHSSSFRLYSEDIQADLQTIVVKNALANVKTMNYSWSLRNKYKFMKVLTSK